MLRVSGRGRVLAVSLANNMCSLLTRLLFSLPLTFVVVVTVSSSIVQAYCHKFEVPMYLAKLPRFAVAFTV